MSARGNKFNVSETVGVVLMVFACVAWYVFVRDFFVPLAVVAILVVLYLWLYGQE